MEERRAGKEAEEEHRASEAERGTSLPAGGRVTVVLLHGLGQSTASWQAVRKVSSTARQAVCPSLFNGTEQDSRYGDVYRRLERALDALPGRLFLCGLSIGAVLATEYAVRHPERVCALIPVAGWAQMPTGVLKLQDILLTCMPRSCFAGIGLKKKHMLRLLRTMRDIDLRKELHRIRCPVAAVCGRKDRINAKGTRELARYLPAAKVRFISGAGHQVNEEAPDALATILDGMYLSVTGPVHPE